MADSAHRFPTEDALCEHCGYPLRGLSPDAACPECGVAVAASSPDHRDVGSSDPAGPAAGFWRMFFFFMFQPGKAFRRLSLNGHNLPAQVFLFRTTFLACFLFSLFFVGTWMIVTKSDPSVRVLTTMGTIFILSVIAINVLTYVEMLGVTAFSKRRGWRVPFHLAERVCCYASVGWLPGVVLAGVGVGLLQVYGPGRPWFEHLLGLVRVGWLFYGGLFVLSLLWFETLVWLGVRQVKFANGWPDAHSTEPAADEPAPVDA